MYLSGKRSAPFVKLELGNGNNERTISQKGNNDDTQITKRIKVQIKDKEIKSEIPRKLEQLFQQHLKKLISKNPTHKHQFPRRNSS